MMHTTAMLNKPTVDLLMLREALEAFWSSETSYLSVWDDTNPALGQYYSTCRVVQHYFPETEVVKGKVWNGKEEHIHFWNRLQVGKTMYDIDLSWHQFPIGSSVQESEILDCNELKDGDTTVKRCDLLLERVNKQLQLNKGDYF